MQPALAKIRPYRILIVDAEDAFRRKAVLACKGAGHEAWGYSEVREGVVAAAFRSPDLILVDFGLAGKGATELFRHVRDREETAHVPFLFYSRGGHPLEIRRGISVPPGVILRKPFTARRLLEFLQPLLKRLAKVSQLGQQDAVAGALTDLELHDLLGALRHFHRSGILTLFSGDGRAQAVTRFVDGTPISARTGKLEGPEVLLEITSWQDGAFDFRAYPPDARPALPPPSAREAWLELMTSLQMLDQARLNPFPLKLQEDPELAHEGSDSTHELETHAIVSVPSREGSSEPDPAPDQGLELHSGGVTSDASTTATLELEAARVLKVGQPPSPADRPIQEKTLELIPVGMVLPAPSAASDANGRAAGERSGSEATLELVPDAPGDSSDLATGAMACESPVESPGRPSQHRYSAAPLEEARAEAPIIPGEGDRTLHLGLEHVHTPQAGDVSQDAAATLEHALVDLTRSDLTPVELLPADRTRSDFTPVELLPADRTRSDLTPVELLPVELTPTEDGPLDFTPVDLTPSARLERLPTGALALSRSNAPDDVDDRTSATTDRLPHARLQQLSQTARRENTDELRLEDIINAAEPALAENLRAGLMRMKEGAALSTLPIVHNPFHDDDLSGELDVALARLLEGEGVLASPPPQQEEPEELVPELLPELDLLDLTPTPPPGRNQHGLQEDD